MTHSTTYPRADAEDHLKWWIGCKNWNRFTPAQKARVAKLRREGKSCVVVWELGRTHPEIHEV